MFEQTWELLEALEARFRNQNKASEEPVCQAKQGKMNLLFREANKETGWVNILHYEVAWHNIEAASYTNETEAASYM